MKKSVPTIEEVKENFNKIKDESDTYIEFIKSEVENLRYVVEKKGIDSILSK